MSKIVDANKKIEEGVVETPEGFKSAIAGESNVLKVYTKEVTSVHKSHLNFEETAAYIISLVVVFPTLPVIPITGILYKLLLYLANCCIHLIVSSTLTIVLSLYLSLISSISILSSIHAIAPLSKASL